VQGDAFAKDPQKLVFVFQKQKDPASLKEHSEKVAQFLTKELDMPVSTLVPLEYSASVQALASKTADIAYTDSIPYLIARREAGATILLAEQREDATGAMRTDYDSIFVVPADSPYKSMEDIKANAKNIRIAFTSRTSTSGYVMAYRRLVNEGILKPKQDPKDVFKSVDYSGSYTLALEAVASGRADICAVSFYTLEGPKAGLYLPEETRNKLRVLTRTTGVPTHVIIARGGISNDLKTKITDALLKLSKEQPELLGDVYGAKSFVKVDPDKHVQATVEAFEYLGIDPKTFTKK
jgi:phosphonate transport system substrate-binding protein